MNSRKKHIVLLLVLLSGLTGSLSAQLQVTPAVSAQAMADAIAGQGIQLSNPQLTGAANAYGTYSTENTELPFGRGGIILTTGKANYAIGPNNIQHRSYINSEVGSTLLDSIFDQDTYDAAAFEFDIIPQGDTLRFNFTFASEEYHNFVGSIYSDVFGFFISGPGIDGYQNIALVPESNDPVSINSINLVTNSEYLFDNDDPAGDDLQYNAYTIGLQAVQAVDPCQTYHLIMVIADVNDYSIDSGVFIEQIESNNASLQSATAGGIDYMVEGCNDGELTFSRLSENNDEDLLVTFFVQGTAVNGVDYLPQIGIDPDPLLPKFITIPSGQNETTIDISPLDDGIINSDKYIQILLASTACPNIIYDSLSFPIFDSLIVELPADTQLCIGGSFEVSAIQAGSGYSWSPAANMLNPDSSASLFTPDTSTWVILETTASDCYAIDSFYVAVSNPQLEITSIDAPCFGTSSGEIHSVASGGIGPMMITWSGPNGFVSTDFDLVGLEAGTYSYQLRDTLNCLVSGEVEIIENPEIIVDIDANTIGSSPYHVACEGDSSANIYSFVSGGSEPYQYIWAPGGSDAEELQNAPAGLYTLLIIDSVGCNAFDTLTVKSAPPIQMSIDSIFGLLCNGSNEGYIEVSSTGGYGIHSYEWDQNPSLTGSILQNVMAGAYELMITDELNCSFDTLIYLSQAAELLTIVLDSSSNVTCPGGSDAEIYTTILGGIPPYDITWMDDGAVISEDRTALDAGWYTLFVTDSLDCQAELRVQIIEMESPLTVSASSIDPVICAGDSTGSIAISTSGGSGNYTYSWSNGAVNVSSLFNLLAGIYTVVVNDTGLCAQTTSIDIEISSLIDSVEIQLTPSDYSGYGLSCFESQDGSIDLEVLSGDAPYTFAWTNADGFSSDQEDLSGLEAGTYYIEVTDNNGCSANDSITLDQADEIILNFTMTPATCPTPGSNDGSISIDVSGGEAPYTFDWSGPGGYSSTDEDITGLEAGVYSLTIEDTRSCSESFTVTVTQPDNFIVTADLSSYVGGWNIDCFGNSSGSIEVEVSNLALPYTLEWVHEGSIIDMDTLIEDQAAGDYELIISDANNCIENRFYSLDQPDSLEIQFDPNADAYGNSVSCYGGSDAQIDAIISGGNPAYNYDWTLEDGSNSNAASISGLIAGNYILEVSDANACVTIESIIITEPDTLYLQLQSPDSNGYNVSCFGGNDGQIITNVIGGSPIYNFNWTDSTGANVSNDQNPTSLAAGTYYLEVIDANGCSATDSITLIASDPLNFNATLSDFNGVNILCPGDSSGQITLEAIGGNGPYSYQWTDGYSDSSRSDLIAGIYTGQIIDAFNCSIDFEIELFEADPIVADFTTSSYTDGIELACYNDSNAFIYPDVNGGVPTYTYSWTGPDGFTSIEDSITDLSAGLFMLAVSDLNGCSETFSIEIEENDSLDLSINEVSPLTCFGEANAALLASPSGGSGIYSINWTGPNGFSSDQFAIQDLEAGLYCATIIDQNGCDKTLCYEVLSPAALSISLSTFDSLGVNILCNGDSSAWISTNVSGGTGIYSYQWNGPDGFYSENDSIYNLIAGSYSLIVSDQFGCSADSIIVLNEMNALQLDLSSSDYNGFALSCVDSDDAWISMELTGGQAAYSYELYNSGGLVASGDSISDLAAGSYWIISKDALACQRTDSVELIAPDSLNIMFDALEYYPGIQISCADGSNGQMEAIVSGGVPDYTLSWTGPNAFSAATQEVSQLPAGTYYLNIIDANGCMLTDSILLADPDDSLVVSISNPLYASGTNISCYGLEDGAMGLDISGGLENYTIYWQGPNSFTSNADTISGLSAGEYFVTVVDSASCTFSQSIILSQPDTILYLDLEIVQNDCFGDSIASITTNIFGGSPGYNYTWSINDSTIATDQDLSGLSNGNYLIEVLDTNGCMLTDSVMISSQAAYDIQSTIDSVNCFGIDDGSISLVVNGGGSSYDYEWSDSSGVISTDPMLADLAPGQYCVSIISDVGCSTDLCYELLPAIQILISDSTNDATCGEANGSVSLTIEGGSAPYQVDWGFTQGENIDELYAGDYNALIQDAYMCSLNYSITIEGVDSLEADATIQGISCLDSTDAMISVNVSGGSSPYEYLWLGPEGFVQEGQVIDSLQAGTYQLSLTDSLGCSLFEEYTVEAVTAIDASFFVEEYDNGFNVSLYGMNDGLIEITDITGGNPGYTVSWNGPNSFTSSELVIGDLIAGNYLVDILDSNNCLFTDSLILTEPASTVLPTGFTPNNDGFNDHFVIPGNTIDNQILITVYNRWGEKVYENSDYDNSWDGSNSSGEALADGTYFVAVEIPALELKLNGYVDLRR